MGRNSSEAWGGSHGGCVVCVSSRFLPPSFQPSAPSQESPRTQVRQLD